MKVEKASWSIPRKFSASRSYLTTRRRKFCKQAKSLSIFHLRRYRFSRRPESLLKTREQRRGLAYKDGENRSVLQSFLSLMQTVRRLPSLRESLRLVSRTSPSTKVLRHELDEADLPSRPT